MPLLPGTRIGPYAVTAGIGAGGMGEVYLARDTKLDRDVALKVLPQNVSGDTDRLGRLQREARALATLNHPNIAHVYGLESADGVTALAMELVEGPTLADRIAAGPIPIDEALPIARQIADALEAAHEQGIVHRDLKPANVKVRLDGTVKVLDFGLARAVEPTLASASLLPTLTSPAMTGVGVILGTAAYMSPEQAKGKPVDRRADIWAFGVVLAEMLTGKRMFDGETVSETLASVMKDVPVIPDAPPAIKSLLTRCLQRDPRARLRDIGEARIVLEDPASEEWAAAASVPPVRPARARVTWAFATVAATIAGVAIGWTVRPVRPSVDAPLRKVTLPVDNLIHGTTRTPQISPDGTKIVYSSAGRLWVRDLAALDPRAIVTEGDPRFYTWSPDSTEIGYLSSDNRIMKVPVAGGAPAVVTVLRQALGSGIGTAWTTDGMIVLTTGMPGTGLQRVSADGGDLTTILAPIVAEQDFHDVSSLPDDKGLLYALDRGGGIVDTIMVLAGGSAKAVLQLEGETIRAPLYASTGHILYERTSNNPGIWALPFSLDDLTSTGEPFLAVPGGTFPSVSREGTLMFMPPVVVGPQELVWMDRTGVVIETIGRSLPGLMAPSLSPDGRLVAAIATENLGTDIWVFDTTRGTQARLTFGEGDENYPAWSPSGDRVFFTRTLPPRQERTIATQPADGTGQSQVTVDTRLATTSAVSPDGKFIAFSEPGTDSVKTGAAIWYAPLDGGALPRVFVDDVGPQSEPRFSPDGRYLAYQSAESGRNEVYVKAFPGGEGKWRVSVDGGAVPRWGRRVNRLFFFQFGTPTKVMEAEVSIAGAFAVRTPSPVADFLKVGSVAPGWDVSADGTRFLLARQAPNAPRQSAPMTIVQNWFAEFRNRRQ
jgi:serine/threonine protein kinase/Tol biopolymer transport system component